jgi:hypothetical protein
LSAHSGALEAVDRVLNRGGTTEEVLGGVLAALHERLFGWVAVAGREVGERPAPGMPSLTAPVIWQGMQVGELQAVPRVAAAGDEALLERVALLISAQLR